jgi:catechol 2,3-dioxygenase-like lactoylglutathione lyase family enzyme
MIAAFDSLTIEVPDLALGQAEYTALLGEPPVGDRWHLGNIAVTLHLSPGAASAQISALALLDLSLSPGASEPLAGDCRGLGLTRAHSREPGYSEEPTPTGIYAIDHVVLQTRDADDCIRLFRDDLGLRLALDQTVPEFGGRMLFFRHGKLTLEVIQSLESPPERDTFWGITYLCRDLERTVAALDQRGVAHSEIRTGRKPGTRVATVRSHCLGLPTLLIGSE